MISSGAHQQHIHWVKVKIARTFISSGQDPGGTFSGNNEMLVHNSDWPVDTKGHVFDGMNLESGDSVEPKWSANGNAAGTHTSTLVVTASLEIAQEGREMEKKAKEGCKKITGQ